MRPLEEHRRPSNERLAVKARVPDKRQESAVNIYGDRYAEVGRFIGYCQDLNVKTDERELEYYERTGVMLPVARVVYPGEFIVQLDRHEQDGDYGWNGFDEWPDLAGLAEKFSPSPRRNKALDDEDLVYCFDRAMDSGGNPYLTVPDAGHTLREEGRLPIRSIPIRSIQWYLNTVHQLRLSVGAIVGPCIGRRSWPNRWWPRLWTASGQPSGSRRRNRLA